MQCSLWEDSVSTNSPNFTSYYLHPNMRKAYARASSVRGQLGKCFRPHMIGGQLPSARIMCTNLCLCLLARSLSCEPLDTSILALAVDALKICGPAWLDILRLQGQDAVASHPAKPNSQLGVRRSVVRDGTSSCRTMFRWMTRKRATGKAKEVDQQQLYFLSCGDATEVDRQMGDGCFRIPFLMLTL